MQPNCSHQLQAQVGTGHSHYIRPACEGSEGGRGAVGNLNNEMHIMQHFLRFRVVVRWYSMQRTHRRTAALRSQRQASSQPLSSGSERRCFSKWVGDIRVRVSCGCSIG
jgi:hypothetical protein